jgi:gas vesicle protein
MGQDPAAIREEIEQTRERMGDTVDALGYKADVPSRAKDSISDKVQGVRAKITGAGSQVSDATPDSDDVKQAGRRAVGIAQENPLGLAIGAAAVGFIAGLLIPSTTVEDERLGPVADQVKEQAHETGQEAIEHGKRIAQDTVQTAAQKAQEVASEVKDTAQESAQQHAAGLKGSVQDSAEAVKQTAQQSPPSNADHQA